MKIVKYGAEWCGPCRATSLNLKDSKVDYEEIDVDTHPEYLDTKSIKSIPYIEVFKDNETIPCYTHRGLLTIQQINEIKEKYG